MLLWHGWVLEGAGSNVYTARIAEVYRREGHDVDPRAADVQQAARRVLGGT